MLYYSLEREHEHASPARIASTLFRRRSMDIQRYKIVDVTILGKDVYIREGVHPKWCRPEREKNAIAFFDS